MRRFLIASLALVLTMTAAGIAAGKPQHQAGFTTTVKAYAVGLSGWQTKPILSANDDVPETGNGSARYRMVGIPDGLGVLRRGRGARLFMNHEFSQADVSEPRVGRPQQRGAFVSEWRLNGRGQVLSGRRAFDTVYQDTTLVGP